MRFSFLAFLGTALSLDPFRAKFTLVLDPSKPDVTDSFTVKVTPKWSPIGAQRFKELVELSFYDDTRFFRVIPGFMAQFGLSGDPAASADWRGKPIDDDKTGLQSNRPGTITFAKTGAPNSRTTQLFINYEDNARLDGMGFTPFAEVEGDGMAVVKKLYNCGERPNQGSIQSKGNKYLDADFPQLSKLTKVELLEGDSNAEL